MWNSWNWKNENEKLNNDFLFCLSEDIEKYCDWYIVFKGYLPEYLFDWCQVESVIFFIELEILFKEKNWTNLDLPYYHGKNKTYPFTMV